MFGFAYFALFPIFATSFDELLGQTEMQKAVNLVNPFVLFYLVM